MKTNKYLCGFLSIAISFSMSMPVKADIKKNFRENDGNLIKYEQSAIYEDSLKNEAMNHKEVIYSTDNYIDIAYQNMMHEENYIVDLINKVNDNDYVTTLSNWKYNLEYLKNNYNMISAIEGVNIDYINSYIEGYTYTLHSLLAPEEKVRDEKMLFSTYNRGNAVDYALKYIKNYNTNYPNWGSSGGDCANFVSQCLYAGGKAMKGTPGTESAAQDWNNWFSKGNTTTTKNVSSTWRGAAAFRDYWQRNSSGYKTFYNMNSDAYNYGYRGDAISLLNDNGRAYHTLIITSYGATDFYIAAHSDGYVVNGQTYLLSKRNLSKGFIIYNMN